MQKFYESFTFIMAFMITSLIIEMSLGEKFLRWFLLLVLFSMVMVNIDKFINFMDGKFTVNSSGGGSLAGKTKEEIIEDADKAGSGHGGILG